MDAQLGARQGRRTPIEIADPLEGAIDGRLYLRFDVIAATFSTVAMDQSSVFGPAFTLRGTRRSQPDSESATGAGC